MKELLIRTSRVEKPIPAMLRPQAAVLVGMAEHRQVIGRQIPGQVLLL